MGFISINSCCCGDDGGYSSIGYTYSRKIILTDTNNRILEISYKNTDTKFLHNDTIVDLVISENLENTLFIKTKNDLDTIVLFNKLDYYYNTSECEKDNLIKNIKKTPIIVSHTCKNAFFKTFTGNPTIDNLILTP